MLVGKRRPQVRVHVQGGPSIEGTLWRRTRSVYLLQAAKALAEDQPHPVDLGGTVAVPRERVIFYQVL